MAAFVHSTAVILSGISALVLIDAGRDHHGHDHGRAGADADGAIPNNGVARPDLCGCSRDCRDGLPPPTGCSKPSPADPNDDNRFDKGHKLEPENGMHNRWTR